MYCPKCHQSFEEGSRRFCPTDGARLVSEAKTDPSEPQGGIFANLIPKMSGINDFGTRLSEAPGVFVAGGDDDDDRNAGFGTGNEDVFFELDDAVESEADTKLLFDPSKAGAVAPPPETEHTVPPPGHVAKKIDPATVPEGGVNLDAGPNGPDPLSGFEIETPENLVGNLIKGRYRVTEFLGSEETGLVYLAEDEVVDGKTVLVKVHVNDEIDEMMSSILAEERISLSHFSHPNIARFIDSGEFVNGVPFIISEYVDGLTVADILSIHGQFDPKRASRIIRQISNALNEAHQEGILHRDIRPENVVIDPESAEVEQAKLVNFGASGGEPNSDNLVYKSPEVIDGRINTIVSDIYSLGVVAFEMLTGTLPFEGGSKNEILRSQYAGPAKMPSDIRPELPTGVDEVLLKAVAFRPAERYKKARDFGDALSGAFAAAPGESRTERPNIVDLQPLVSDLEPEKQQEEAQPSPRIQMPPAKRQIPMAHRARDLQRPELGDEVRGNRVWMVAAAIAILAVIGSAIGWYYYSGGRGLFPAAPVDVESASTDSNVSNIASANNDTEIPPAQSLAQPPNTNAYRNTREELKGDLEANFIGFSLYYPTSWKFIGPQPGTSASARGKFLDISRSTSDGRLQEQMLISYYPSGGTYEADAGRFSQLVRETNATLEKILPGYQMVSEGATTLRGGRQAYEVKFQGGGTSSTGDKLMVWGRRLFVPAAQAGVPSGYEITMLATSHASDVRGVDEVGVRGELGPILDSFEPAQNF